MIVIISITLFKTILIMFSQTTLCIVLTLAFITQVSSQDIDSTLLTTTGSIDTYFRLNLNADYDASPATSFANLPSFALGMANVNATYYKKKAGITLDLVVGPRGEDATFLSPFLRPGGTSSIVNQLFTFVDITDRIKVTLGNFNTFLGYEMISPTENFNYSTSYMFSYGPFSHTGLKIEFDIGRGLTLMTGVFNPTDATEYNPTNDYTFGAQLGYANDDLYMNFNTLTDGDYYQVDLTAGLQMTENLFGGINTTYATDAFAGYALYLQYILSEDLTIGTRVERFIDKGIEAIGAAEQDVVDVTLTANYKIENLTLIPEIRIDKASQEIFPTNTEFEKSLSSFVLAAVYDF